MIYRFSDLQLDVGRRELSRGGETIHLTNLNFQVLKALLESAPDLLSQDELIDRAWGENRIVTPENLVQRIKVLREALGDNAEQPRYIEAIRGQGIRMIPEVATGELSAAPATEQPAAPSQQKLGNPGLLVAIGAVALLAWWWLSPSGEPEVSTTEPQPTTVAVLPFDNLTDDPNYGYFGDGMSEEIINVLVRETEMGVIARTSSFQFKGQPSDTRDIGQMLGATHVLEGSVRRSGQQLRITAQLIDSENGLHLWSQNYDRTYDNLFDIQDEIAADVARTLDTKLRPEPDSSIGTHSTINSEAYDLYLRALAQQAIGTVDSLAAGDVLLEEALALDPDFPDAKLALVRSQLVTIYQGTREFVQLSEAADVWLEDLLEADPSNLLARQYDLRLRALIASAELDMTAYHSLMEELVASFAEGSGDPFVRSDAAHYLVRQAKPDEALALLQDGLITDPLNVDLLLAQARLLKDLEGLDAAEQKLQTALLISPEHPGVLWHLGWVEFERENMADGLRYMRRLQSAEPQKFQASAEIAAMLNEFGFYEQSERWMDLYRSGVTDRSAVIGLDVQLSAERNDEANLKRIVPAAIEAYFAGEIEAPHFVVWNEYAVMMINDGRSREGLDDIESQFPGISQIGSEEVYQPLERYIQWYTVMPLLEDLTDDETNRYNIEALVTLMDQHGEVVDARHRWYVPIQYRLHGLDAGRAAFFEQYINGDIYILDQLWHHFKRAPWAAQLKADPEVAAALEERELRLGELRQQVGEMLAEPEWQRGPTP